MEQPIDPVARPDAYTKHVLSLLGENDPDEVQSATGKALRDIVRDSGPDLRTRPEPGEWSVVELLGHFVDSEIVAAARYRWILAHDEPELVGYDQDLWVQGLRYQEADPEELFGVFDPLRSANLALWRRSSEAERARIGRHLERGPQSYDVTFRLIAGHDRFHLDQMRKTLDVVRG